MPPLQPALRWSLLLSASQAERFTHDPKQSHASAVKTIVRYLAKTPTKRTILVKKLSSKLTLKCFVDADFAGLYRRDPDASIDSVKSRGEYIIKL